MKKTAVLPLTVLLTSLLCFSCQEVTVSLSMTSIRELDLKTGEIISCGPGDLQLGTLAFDITGAESSKEDFLIGLKLLHSFEYDEAEKVFSRIISNDPTCAMAYWGVAMSNFHALWAPPSEQELKKGEKALAIAKTLERSPKESDYIASIGSFYNEWDKTDHRTRSIRFEKAMEALYGKYPADKEVAIFYSLSLNAAADPADKTFTKQKKAAGILDAMYASAPEHPGVVHYIIHSYDYPELAKLALPAARKYASVAPSSAHALHMPSHIFTRLGLWRESISSNLASINAAKCYAEAAGMKGHWDEELHGLDYLVYAYLQNGQNKLAKEQWDYLNSIDEVHPSNFKVAYAFAAIPSRYLLENRMWKEAAALEIPRGGVAWEKFSWQKGILHFTRLMGSIHINNMKAAAEELAILKTLHDQLLKEKDLYKSGQVEIQMKTAEAWMKFKTGDHENALVLMRQAADMEDKTGKHPVTPGEVIPARELLGDLLMQMNKWTDALAAFEANLATHPNRFNGLFGAGLAAERSGAFGKAKLYYGQLISIAGAGNTERAEIKTAKEFIQQHGATTTSKVKGER